MHKGRPYPYHPHYDVTDGWFWPGFLPWKLGLDVYNNGLPPWNIYPSGYGEVSQPGVPFTNNKGVIYDFTHFNPSFGLRVELDTFLSAGKKFCRYRLRLLGAGGLVEFAQAIHAPPVPQRVVFATNYEFVFPDPPYTANQSPPYQLTPSRYDQGGSPWPN